jgi:hypothetical protein
MQIGKKIRPDKKNQHRTPMILQDLHQTTSRDLYNHISLVEYMLIQDQKHQSETPTVAEKTRNTNTEKSTGSSFQPSGDLIQQDERPQPTPKEPLNLSPM